MKINRRIIEREGYSALFNLHKLYQFQPNSKAYQK